LQSPEPNQTLRAKSLKPSLHRRKRFSAYLIFRHPIHIYQYETTTMSIPEKDALPPSYTETLHSLPTGSASSSRGQSILDQLTLVRAQHIRTIITNHILPHISQRAAQGLAKSIIALLPSDIPVPAPEEKNEFSFDTTNAQSVELIGFSSDESPKVITLEGQLNKTEFWRTQAVTEELERRLGEELNAREGLAPKTPEKEVPQKQPKRSFFNKVTGRGPEVPSPSGNPEVGVKQVDTTGQVLVKVRLEELCLRTVNEFGLYDTLSKQCVVVRVDARC
jgi:hypothetical protein